MTIFDLHEAVAAAKPRSTIRIPGTVRLTSKLVIKKPLTLVGGAIIGDAKDRLVDIRADVTLRDLTITRTKNVGFVVVVTRGRVVATNVTFRGGKCDPRENKGSGIAIDAGSTKLVGCTVEKNHDGVLVGKSAKVVIEKLVARDNKNTGVAFCGRSTGSISHATFERNFVGMYFGDTTAVAATSCTIVKSKLNGITFRHRCRPILSKVVANDSGQHGFCACEDARPRMIACATARSKYQGFFWYDRAAGSLEECRASESKYNGFNLYGTTAVLLKGCEAFDNGAQGILCGDKARPRIENTSAHDNAIAGFNAWETAKPVLVGCTGRDNKDSGVLIMGKANVVVEDGTFETNRFDGISVLETSTAKLVNNRCEGNQRSGIEFHDGCNAEARGNSCPANKEDGFSILINRKGRVSLVGNKAARNDDDLYIDDEFPGIHLADNDFKEITPDRYFVEIAKGTKLPKLVEQWIAYCRGLAQGRLGDFEIIVGKLDTAGYEQHAHRLKAALQFADCPDGSKLALLDIKEPRPVVLIGSEGELRTVANSFGDFLHALAEGKTKVHELKLAKPAKDALRAWLRERKVKKTSGKLFDFAAYLGAGGPISDEKRLKALAKDLAKVTGAIDKLVAKTDPELAKALRGPAKQADLDAFAKARLFGKLPPDLAVWFAWHDGQTSFTGLHPDENWTMVSAKHALGHWDFLNHDPDCLRPARASLLPLFENGGGDNLMYECAGPSAGALYTYWHDDDDPPARPSYASLAAWVENAIDGRTKWASAERVTSELDWDDVKWKKVESLALDDAPIGTAYYRWEYLTMWDGPAVHMFVKVTLDAWAEAWDKTVAGAIDEITRTVAKEPEKAWSRRDGDVTFGLTSDKSQLDKLSPKKIPPGLFRAAAKNY